MENLTQFTDEELSLRVFNDEYFYIERGNKPYLLALVAEEFIYTSKQMEVLTTDLEVDKQEIEE